jgi:hypothetical protein
MSNRTGVLESADGRHSSGLETVTPGMGLKTIIQAAGNETTPRLVTICYSVQLPWDAAKPQPLPSPNQCALRAKLTWGNGSADHTAFFDWGRGGHITIAATGFTFSGGYDAVEVGPKCTLIALAAYETRSSHEANRVTCTQRFSGLVDGTPVIIPIVNFARFATLLLSDLTAIPRGVVSMEILDIDGSVVYTYLPVGSSISDAVELPINAWFIRLKSTSPTPYNGAVLLNLAL